MKECPYCAEEIQDKAIKCKYCGEWLKEEYGRGVGVKELDETTQQTDESSTGVKELDEIVGTIPKPVRKPNWVLILVFFGLSFTALFLMFSSDESTKHTAPTSSKIYYSGDEAFEQAVAAWRERNKEALKAEREWKQRINDHTTIADDISVSKGRSLEEGRALVAKHFGITYDQLTAINLEGLERHWSMPPRSAKNEPEYRYLH